MDKKTKILNLVFVVFITVLIAMSFSSCDAINKIKYNYENSAQFVVKSDTYVDSELLDTCVKVITSEKCINSALSKTETTISYDEFLKNLTIVYVEGSGIINLRFWGFEDAENKIIIEAFMEYLQTEIEGISCELLQITTINHKNQ